MVHKDQSSFCIPFSLYGPGKFIYQTSAFPSPCSCLLPLSSPKSLPLISFSFLLRFFFFFFKRRWYFRWGFSHFGELLNFPRSLPCIHVTKLLFDFLLFICLIVNLILRPSRKNPEQWGNFLPLWQRWRKIFMSFVTEFTVKNSLNKILMGKKGVQWFVYIPVFL